MSFYFWNFYNTISILYHFVFLISINKIFSVQRAHILWDHRNFYLDFDRLIKIWINLIRGEMHEILFIFVQILIGRSGSKHKYEFYLQKLPFTHLWSVQNQAHLRRWHFYKYLSTYMVKSHILDVSSEIFWWKVILF